MVWSDSLYFYPFLLASAPWPDKNWSILEAEVPDVANNHQCFDQVLLNFQISICAQSHTRDHFERELGRPENCCWLNHFNWAVFSSWKNVKMEMLVKTKALRTGLGSHSKIFFYWHLFTWSRLAIHLIHLTFKRPWRSRPWTKDESES